MMLAGVVSGRIDQPSRFCHSSVYAKSVTKPSIVAAAPSRGLIAAKSCAFVAK
jgi:hypothetical protein